MPPIEGAPGFFQGVKLLGLEDDEVTSNSEILVHGISTRFNSHLHLPSTTLTSFQKGVSYSGGGIYLITRKYSDQR
jgi:hypothetical protein